MANILLVDDDLDLQEMYSTALQGAGHNVVVASNGEEGLSQANQYQFDIILLDMMMPKLDGLGFLNAYDLRKHPSVKVLVFTNQNQVDQINKALALGVSGYLEKADVIPAKLVEMVNSTLGSQS